MNRIATLGLMVAAVGLCAVGDRGASAANAGPRAVASHCKAGEAVVYSCTIKGKIASVCATDASVSYRYGKPGAPELNIVSNGHDGKAHQGGVVGGGGGSQPYVRFSNGAYQYIVFSGEAGSLTDKPGRQWSGVAVLKDKKPVSNLACPNVGGAAALMSSKVEFVDEETDSDYEAWW